MVMTQRETILDANRGLAALLNNELTLAHEILSNDASCFHGVGLGLAKFLEAALGIEDSDLQGALSTLVKAETVANAQLGVKQSKDEAKPVFEAGTEYRLLVSVAVLCQALVHVLTESYVEFVKAVYKLNRSYKGFAAVYKIVFPVIADDDSVATIITNLNTMYVARTTAPINGIHATVLPLSPSSISLTSISSSLVGSLFGKRRSASNASALRPSSSATVLPSLSSLSLQVPIDHTSSRDEASSVPSSRASSVLEFSTKRGPKRANGDTEECDLACDEAENDDGMPVALWKSDPLSSLVISGAAFGFGLFGLIFSLLPPKLRKVIAWFGFGSNSRTAALKLLTVAATTGRDTNGSFAALALVTYYCVILLMSGWQNDEAYLVAQCEAVLSRVEQRFPNGTLWVLNRAKICRMKHDTASAIKIIEGALQRESTFRQADSLLVFELSWLYLSNGEFVKAADSFMRMKELNAWSHSTYVFIAAGALLDLSRSKRTPEIEGRIEALFLELPSLIGKKRLMGEPPATEVFISRKVAAYKVKHARWIAEGRLDASSKFWDVIRVSPASELGHFWNTTGRAPIPALATSARRLSSFTPLPRLSLESTPAELSSVKPILDRKTSTASKASLGQKYDLDVDEVCIRDLLLGSMYRTMGHLKLARGLLQDSIDAEPFVGEERWASAFSKFELAVCTLAEADIAAPLALHDHALWRSHLLNADKLLDAVFATSGEYNLRSRLESRAQMLRDEISAKRATLASA